jgi:hypothetical protein
VKAFGDVETEEVAEVAELTEDGAGRRPPSRRAQLERERRDQVTIQSKAQVLKNKTFVAGILLL